MDPLAHLTGINLDDLVSSFGWQDSSRLSAMLRAVFRSPAKKFAHQMLDFDTQVGLRGLQEGALETMPIFARDIRVYGREHINETGSLLVLSNHPGMTDTLALFSALRRLDLRVIALNRPFLQSLPNVSSHLFYLDDDPGQRMRAVRRAATHLRSGGSLLTFPAGEIEPDPAVYPGALEALNGWTDSAGVFLRFAPETRIVPALVSNVLWSKAVNHPLTRVKRERFEREKLGAALQLLLQILFNARPVTVQIQFAKPVTLDEVGSMDAASIHRVVIERMQTLLQNSPVGEGESVLADESGVWLPKREARPVAG
jgi:hypothetical protein